MPGMWNPCPMSLREERAADAAVKAAHARLAVVVDDLLRDARAGRLLTLATPSVTALANARAALEEARQQARDAMGDPAPDPKAYTLHAFAPDAQGHCTTCGKGWAGGHPATVAPPIEDRAASP